MPSTFIQLFIIENFKKKIAINIYTIIYNIKILKNKKISLTFIQLLITEKIK